MRGQVRRDERRLMLWALILLGLAIMRYAAQL